MPDVQRIARGIEAAIERQRAFGEALGERVAVRAVGMKAAPLELFEKGHRAAELTGRRRRRARAFLMQFVVKASTGLLSGKTICRARIAAPTSHFSLRVSLAARNPQPTII